MILLASSRHCVCTSQTRVRALSGKDYYLFGLFANNDAGPDAMGMKTRWGSSRPWIFPIFDFEKELYSVVATNTWYGCDRSMGYNVYKYKDAMPKTMVAIKDPFCTGFEGCLPLQEVL